jgi:DNA replication protein DnaC
MSCDVCHGTRWKPEVRDGIERLVRCDCWRAEMAERHLLEARIPQRYSRCELSTFEHDTDSQRDAFRRASAFVQQFPAVDRGLLLYGPNGVGKTHLAVGMLKAVMRTRGARGFFFETRELLKLVRDTYNRSVAETEMDVLAPVLKADVLVLDDLGAERTSDWVQETLGLVVNTRYNERRPTIFTSNLVDSPDSTDPRSFIYQLGSRTRSRLAEMCDWVEMHGVDMREVGPHASADAIQRWQRSSPASPENARKATTAVPRPRGPARAQLPAAGRSELKWPGGRAGNDR